MIIPSIKLMRIAFHDDAVLTGSGFAFIRIAAQINRLSGVLRNKAPLHSGRKSRAAAAAKACRFRHFDYVLRASISFTTFCAAL